MKATGWQPERTQGRDAIKRKSLHPHGGGASLKAENYSRRNRGTICDTSKCAILRGRQRKICVKKLLDGGQFNALSWKNWESRKRGIQIWGWVQRRRNLRSKQVKHKWKYTKIMSLQGLLISFRKQKVLTVIHRPLPTGDPLPLRPHLPSLWSCSSQDAADFLPPKVSNLLFLYREVFPMYLPHSLPHLL